jgi:hypothetical protein
MALDTRPGIWGVSTTLMVDLYVGDLFHLDEPLSAMHPLPLHRVLLDSKLIRIYTYCECCNQDLINRQGEGLEGVYDSTPEHMTLSHLSVASSSSEGL